jgi:hypothetical protein
MAEGGMTTASQGIENLQVPMGMLEYSDGGILGYAGDEQQGSFVRDPEEEKKFKIMQILNGYKQEEPPPSAPASDPNADQPVRAARPADTSTRLSRNQPSDFLSDPSFMEKVKSGMDVKNPDEQVAMIRAAQKAAGAKENYGEDQRKRYDEEDEQYKEALKNRGFNNFLNVMSGIGQGGIATFYAVSASEAFNTINFPVPMRTTPTVTFYNGGGTSGGAHGLGTSGDITGVTLDRLSPQGLGRMLKSSGFTAGYLYAIIFQANAEL